ncbi:MAG: ArnT family glycosyltransferase [Coleofasciculus sp.]
MTKKKAIIIKILKYRFIISFLLLLAACYFVFFFRLDAISIRMWDESRRAINAFEMTVNGNWLVTYYDGQPEMVGTKPPLLIWCIALSMKVFGYNEFALRLPSAVCAMSTTIIIFWFGTKYFNDLKIGLISGLVLVTSIGYIGEHVARTGDFDAMLVLWITIYSLSFFTYLHCNVDKKNFYLFIATTALILAVLTKSVAGILAVPGLVLYAAYQRKLGKVLSSPKIYIAAIIFFISVSSFYILREYYNPGYLKAVIANEIIGRYSNTLENHQGPISFYLSQIKQKFVPWVYVLPISFIVVNITRSSRQIKNFVIFGLFYLSSYLLIVSFAQTKLPWYDAPVYPLASMIVGIGLSEILNLTISELQIDYGFKRQLLIGILVSSIFVIPYLDTVYNKIYKHQGIIYDWSQPDNPQLMYGDYFKKLNRTYPKLRNLSVVNNDYNAHLLFYTKVYNLNSYSIQLKSSKDNIFDDEIVVTCDFKIKSYLEQEYNLKLLNASYPCYTFVVRNSKTKS